MDISFQTLLRESWLGISVETGLGECEFVPINHSSPNSILVSIGITGEYEGYFTFQGTTELIFPLMKQMIAYFGLSYSSEEEEDSCLEAFKEITNQVSGRLIMNLHNLEVNCDITPPTMIRGNSLNLDLHQFPFYEEIGLSFPSGKIESTLGIKKR